jgi:hypothetical protein
MRSSALAYTGEGVLLLVGVGLRQATDGEKDPLKLLIVDNATVIPIRILKRSSELEGRDSHTQPAERRLQLLVA